MSFLVNPNMGRIAMREGLELVFVAWSILRDFGVRENLSSHYSKQQAAQILAAHGLKFTSRHYGRIWQRGVGIFWGLDANGVYLRSIKKVAAHFEAFRKDCDSSSPGKEKFVQIQLSGGIENLRAELYWSWFALVEEKTISRDTLKDLFGLSHDQQRAYESRLGARLLVKSNYAHINSQSYSENPRELPEHHFSIKYEREIRFDETIEATTAIQYQLPNTFMARPSTSEFLTVEDASNRAKRAILELFGHTDSSNQEQRIFWLKWSQFEKLGSFESFIRVCYQGKKRLWLSGHYL